MWVVVSSKGGIGKSLIAKNLLVPFVVRKYGKALYVNTDDTNDEHKLVKANNFEIEAVRCRGNGVIFCYYLMPFPRCPCSLPSQRR